MIHDFEYVTKKEYGPVKKELWELIYEVQDVLRDKFTFQFRPIGSSTRNMITRDKKGNAGYDFDINIYPNVDFDDYSAAQLRDMFTAAFNRLAKKYGYSPCEDSTRVLTIKFKNVSRSRIEHSCDIAIILEDEDENEWFIHCKKQGNKKSYEWCEEPDPYELEEKADWIKENGLWQDVKDLYIRLKNANTNPDKKSRSLYAEAVNNIYNEN